MILAGAAFLSVSDAIAKWLGDFYTPAQLLFLRGLIAAPALAGVIVWTQGLDGLRTRNGGLHVFRGLANVVTASIFYAGLAKVPLAAATAVAYSAPLFVTVLSVVLLREYVGWVRWTSVIAGFAGVLVIVRPDSGGFEWAYAYPLAAALGYAILMVSARWIDDGEGMLTTMFYIALGQIVFAGVTMPWLWTGVELSHAPALAALALCSALGLGLITQAFRHAPASLIAPLDYSGLIWAAAIGWLFWREAFTASFFLGAALIVASGLAVMLRKD
jgi:drug/metabolite transporter (DMT)-like permease